MRAIFLEEHPLYETHCVDFNFRKHDIVPNFVGGSLPRSDRGDKEYYCATMLTLFKPWRTGKDLKLQNDSWDDAFTTHKFTSNQVQVMKNFNIRYECLDARDDFSVQLKQGGVSSDGLFPQFMTTELLSDLDDDHMQTTMTWRSLKRTLNSIQRTCHMWLLITTSLSPTRILKQLLFMTMRLKRVQRLENVPLWFMGLQGKSTPQRVSRS